MSFLFSRYGEYMKSPLRYPGGKSRAVKTLLQFFPDFTVYREPFVGGGSVYLALKEQYPNKKYWINDLYTPLYDFWYMLKYQPKHLIDYIQSIKDKEQDGRKLFYSLKNLKTKDILENAVRLFVLSRISFSGTIESGGYSEHAFHSRFTQTAIDKLHLVAPLLHLMRITNWDFEWVIKAPGEGVFLFLDPPYYSTASSKLYGNSGNLHLHFNHELLASILRTSEHKWLLTYDDCEAVRKLYSFAYIFPIELQYGMNNRKARKAKKGKELIITNYPINPQKLP